MDPQRAREILGKLPKSDVVMEAVRVLVNERATVAKTMLYSSDFSGREYAAGKAIAFLEALEYVRDLQASCASALAAKKEKNK